MKKFFTYLVALAVATVANAGEVFYTADFNTEEGFKSWTVVDANNDDKTWDYSASNDEGLRVFYSYDSSNKADDWLISPAFVPEASGRYLVRYGFKGSYYKESAELCLGTSTDVASMTTVLGSHKDLEDKLYGFYTIVELNAGQEYRFGVHAISEPDRWRLYINSFSIEDASSIADLAVTEILSPISGKNLAEEAVTVKVQNVGIDDVDSYSLSFAVNGETVATETVNELLKAGESKEYTFTAKADLSTPRELYNVSVTVEVANDIEASNNTASTSVRHIAEATVPYSTSFEPGEYLDECKSFNLNEDTGDWEIGVGSMWFSMARTGIGFLGYNYDKNNNANDWFILEPIKVEPGYYSLKFWYSGDDSHPEKLAVYYGNACDPEAMTNKVVEYAPFARGAYEESINIIKFDEAQTVYFGFYAFSDKDENWITIDDLSFERVESTDVDVAALSLKNPTDYLPIKSSQKVTFTAKNLGITNQSTSVTIKVDDASRPAMTVNFAAQEEREISIDGLLADLTPGEHTVEISIACDGDKNLENNTLSRTFRILGNPDIEYDFEDGVVPEKFTYKVEDEGTLNSGAVAEFGETGWGLVNIGEHEYFGTKMFAGSSWVDGVEELDRSCILPAVNVETEDACFVWNAGSISPYFFESYQIRVLYEDPTWGSTYDKLSEVLLEGTNRQYRGVNLGRYKGMDVQIQIRMISKPGDALALDNLQFYGCSLATGGVDSVKADSNAAIAVSGNVISVSEDAAITVTDMSGRIVAAAQGASLNISNLATGIYVVTARTANGIATVKIAR